MCDIVDVACDAPNKSEEYSDVAMDCVANPRNKKSAKFMSDVKDNTLIIVKII